MWKSGKVCVIIDMATTGGFNNLISNSGKKFGESGRDERLPTPFSLGRVFGNY